VKEESDLDVVKRKSDVLKQEIEEVKARVKMLEGKDERNDKEEKELERKGPLFESAAPTSLLCATKKVGSTS
jgi:hypothetical protein